MTETICHGRLGNQIIRNLAVSILAEKHDLKVNYCSVDLLNQLGLEFFSGSNTYADTHPLTNDNYFTVLNCDRLEHNLDPNTDFFQTKEITNMLYRYLRTGKVLLNVIKHNIFYERYNNNRDLFIHIRLGDVAYNNPGITYYLNAIKMLNFDRLYISTDTIEHEIIAGIVKAHPSAFIVDFDEISTLQMASTCKYVVLSHGSFSAVMGYLSYFSDVYYPEYEEGKVWYGDMFSIDGWVKLPTK